ncbi:MAG: hypothetical protein KJO07_01935 [Deltaproteobacteria bacterium]|nr:hypothetical protein [Deltaproteobacteria bacterium]
MRNFLLVVAVLLASSAAAAQEAQTEKTSKAIGVQAAIGTDPALGLGFGAGVTVWVPRPGSAFDLEIGGQFFYSHSVYESDEGGNTYEETTDLIVLAGRANLLWDYDPSRAGVYYVLGTGAAGVSVTWEERSDTDTSLGTALPNGGSKQEDDGLAGALIANAGIGFTFGGGFDLRAELPILFFLGEVGEVSAVVPTLTVAAGYRF